MAKILGYIDTVVSPYNSANSTAGFTNIAVANDADIVNVKATDVVTTSLRVGSSASSGYSFPTTKPASPLNNYLAINSSGDLEFKNFNSAGVDISNVSGVQINSPADGDLVHYYNNNLTVDRNSENYVIDGKNPVLSADLKTSDRMLISVDKTGSGTALYQMSLATLISAIQLQGSTTSVIGSLTSNTQVVAQTSDVTFKVDNGSFIRTSLLDNNGLTIEGNITLGDIFNKLYFKNAANGSLEAITSGYKFTRLTDQLSLTFDGTQSVIVKSDEVQLGTGLTLANNCFIDVNANSTMTLNTDAVVTIGNNVTVTADTTIDQDLSSTSASVVTFNDSQASNSLTVGATTGVHLKADIDGSNFRLASFNGVSSSQMVNFDMLSTFTRPVIYTDSTESTSTTTGSLTLAGGIGIVKDVYAGNDVHVANTVFSAQPDVISSSISYKENVNNFDNGLAYVMNMKPVTYDRKNTQNKNEIGFIAEDIENVLPNIVKSGNGIKGIQYGQIIPVLVSALQEQQQKITELENKINK